MLTARVVGNGRKLNELKRKLEEQNYITRAGVLEETFNADGENVAEYAMYNEYGTMLNGTEHIPPRPFMRNTVDRELSNWRAKLQAALHKHVLASEEAMRYIGKVAVDDIRDTLSAGEFEPLADSTVAAKAKAGNPFPQDPLLASMALFHGLKTDTKKGGGGGA